MNLNFDMPLWSQAGGGELIGAVIFLLLVVFQAVKAYLDNRNTRAAEPDKTESVRQQPVRSSPPPKRPQRPPSPLSGPETGKKDRIARGSLSRELAPQGIGERFEADPGTLDASRLVSPSIEPTVKPTLESMTGIYEAAPTSSELGGQPLTLDLQKQIARPDGIRRAVILAEILKRPEF